MQAAVKEPSPIQETWVDSPLTTYAQFLHELDTGVPHAGREKVRRDMRTLIGGFCRFHGSQAQNEAAARFKAIYERSQVGGAKAVDPEKEPVDGGGINPESVIEIGADARRQYIRLINAFDAKASGKRIIEHFEFVIANDHGPTAYARWLLRTPKPDGREVGRMSAEFRRMVDDLAVHLKLQGRV